MRRIELADRYRGDLLIASISGGKDSAALAIALKEAGLPFVAVFADTGWEAPETYAHLDTMERVLEIKIHRVGAPGGMRAKIKERAGFPARMQRWCTRELKIRPLDAFAHELANQEQRAIVQAVGIRADEGEARASLSEIEHDDSRDLTVWRPLLTWTIEDVLAAHHRAGLPVNPLYKRGHNRVGCWPCIFASKEEIALWADHDPARVAEVAALEKEVIAERAARNEEQPGRYAHAVGTFFQAREFAKGPNGERVSMHAPVDRVVEWANTSRGGKQLNIIREQPSGGCFRWGMCEPMSPDEWPKPREVAKLAELPRGDVLVFNAIASCRSVYELRAVWPEIRASVGADAFWRDGYATAVLRRAHALYLAKSKRTRERDEHTKAGIVADHSLALAIERGELPGRHSDQAPVVPIETAKKKRGKR